MILLLPHVAEARYLKQISVAIANKLDIPISFYGSQNTIPQSSYMAGFFAVNDGRIGLRMLEIPFWACSMVKGYWGQITGTENLYSGKLS